MQRNWIIVAAALAGSSVGLAAQGTPRPPRPPRVRAFMMSDHRGRIGVVVKTDASPETDKIGAKIEGVTPGGPGEGPPRPASPAARPGVHDERPPRPDRRGGQDRCEP